VVVYALHVNNVYIINMSVGRELDNLRMCNYRFERGSLYDLNIVLGNIVL
jgi:hypothetical protein